MPQEEQPRLNLGEQVPIADLTMARVREGYEYWNALRGARVMPTRAEILPAAIPHLLPHIILLRVIGPGDFEFRLAGGTVTEAHGFNPTGWRLQDLDKVRKGFGGAMVAFFQKVVDDAAPRAARGTLAHIDKSFRTFEIVYLPLGPEGGPVDHVLGFSDYATKSR